MFTMKPAYIPQSIVDAEIDFRWQGAKEHIGPTETVTPLFLHVGNTTSNAQISLCAGVLLWGSWRFKDMAESDHNFELAEAAFAYQVDWRYVDIEAGPKGKAPDQPPALSATVQLGRYLRNAIDMEEFWESYYQPVSNTFHSIHIVSHILPKESKREFQHWLDVIVERIKRNYAKPDEAFKKRKQFHTEDEYQLFLARHRGPALPPQILDPNFDYKPEERENLVRAFLQSLDISRNRYLRTPEALKELGFKGTPYQL